MVILLSHTELLDLGLFYFEEDKEAEDSMTFAKVKSI